MTEALVSNRHRSPHKVAQQDKDTIQLAKLRCNSILQYLNEGNLFRAEREATQLVSFLQSLTDDNISWSMRRRLPPTFG